MLSADLSRIEQSGHGTIGVLRIEKEVQCFVLEKRSLLIAPRLSCIPPGVYICKRITSPRHGKTFEIEDVPGRTHILFHIGNTDSDTEGCLLLGRRPGYINGKRGILESRLAFYDFMTRLNGVDEFNLTITENF